MHRRRGGEVGGEVLEPKGGEVLEPKVFLVEVDVQVVVDIHRDR
jgi:hypothetical protein